MTWYYVISILIPVLGVLGIYFKNLKWKKIIWKTQVILDEVKVALEDGHITKAEYLKIIEKALDTIL